MDEARPAYRVFDEAGEVLVLRSDMTVPIARVVATRYPNAEPPLRFCYFAHSYRGVRPQRGQPREFLQAGIELIGAAAPARDGRGAGRDLPGARRARARRPTGSASATPACTRRCSTASACSAETRARLLAELTRGDFVGLEAELRGLDAGRRGDRPAAAGRADARRAGRPRGPAGSDRRRRRRPAGASTPCSSRRSPTG